MDIGLGFLVGLLAGTVVFAVGVVIWVAAKRAKGTESAVSGRLRQNVAPSTPAPAPARRSSDTLVLDPMESREQVLNRNIQDVRGLLLRLADVIGGAGRASGEATQAFNSARDVIDNIDPANSDDLLEAQRVLVIEIDRVLQSNIELHGELARANHGIAEQRQQIEELRQQARIDSLTRIPNRTAFDERLQEYLGLLQRANLIFSLLLLDIDLFKQVNDQHGHINGDRVLRGVAARIADSIRTNDFAARYGGEEFAVILPGTNLDEAKLVAERMRRDIAKTNFRLDDQVVKITVSGGLAECKAGMDAEAIVAEADRALYLAKSVGRNCVLTTRETRTAETPA